MTKETKTNKADPADGKNGEENNTLPRIFVYNDNQFEDPFPNEPPEAVMKMLAGVFPELANGEFVEEVKEGKRIIRFRKKAAVNG